MQFNLYMEALLLFFFKTGIKLIITQKSVHHDDQWSKDKNKTGVKYK